MPLTKGQISSIATNVALWVKRLPFNIDMQLEYMQLLNSFLSNDNCRTIDAVRKVRESYAKYHDKGHITLEVSDKLITALMKGQSHVPVIKAYFHPSIAIGFELSQKAGSESHQLNSIADLVALERQIFKDAFQTLAMPFILALLGLISNAAIGHYIIPMLEEGLRTPPAQTLERTISSILGIAIFEYWYLIIAAFSTIIVSYIYAQRNLTGPIRDQLDQTWPFSNAKSIWGLRIMKLLGLLKRAKVRDTYALELLRDYGTPFVRIHIDRMLYDAKVGLGKKNFGNGLLSDAQLIRLSAYRELPDDQFTQALLNASDNAVVDIKLQNKRAITITMYLFILIFLVFGGLGVGAIMKTVMGMIAG